MPVDASTILGDKVRIFKPDLVNIYGAEIGEGTRIGPFVEIQRGVKIGRRCKIQSHVFICEGVAIEDGVFVGHGVMFTNDLWPAATGKDGELLGDGDWQLLPTRIGRGAAIGSGATLLPVSVGAHALVAAGAVVTRDVADHQIVAGNPARVIGDVRQRRGMNEGAAPHD